MKYIPCLEFCLYLGVRGYFIVKLTKDVKQRKTWQKVENNGVQQNNST